MGIGIKLNKLLSEKGINANELATAVGVSPTTIYSMISRDSKKADIDVLIRIAKYLNVSAEYFCNDTIDPTTIAAHLDTDDLTSDEIADVAKYIEFIKQRRNK